MTRRVSWLGRSLAAGIFLGVAAPAAASCTATAQAVSFGAYSTLSSAALDGVGNVNVNCSPEFVFTVKLSAGNNTIDNRLMLNGTEQLGYNLYTDSARLFVWGDGVNGNSVTGTGTTVDLPVYGRVPALQNVRAGTYTDTVVVTVTF